MAIELSVERTSFSEDEFDIVLKDVGYSFDVDQHRFLSERGEDRYQSLLVIERDPESRILTGDLDALRSYPRGVYVLIKTEPDTKHKRRVFVGMAESNEAILDIYRRGIDINLASNGDGHSPTLAQCLEEQNHKCPPYMKGWDLAVIIPEEKNPFFLFGALFSIFKNAEGFISFKTLNRGVSYNLFRMHSDAHYFFAGFEGLDFFDFFEHFDGVSNIFWYIRIFIFVCSIVMKLRNKVAKSEGEKFAKDKKIKIVNKGKGNEVIVNQTENNDGIRLTIKNKGKGNKVIINNYHYLTNVPVGYLNAHFPKQVSPNRQSNYFDE